MEFVEVEAFCILSLLLLMTSCRACGTLPVFFQLASLQLQVQSTEWNLVNDSPWQQSSQGGPQSAGAYPGFCSMKQLRVLLLSPGWDASPSQGFAAVYCWYPFVHLGLVVWKPVNANLELKLKPRFPFLLFKRVFTANSKWQFESNQSQNVGQKKILQESI